MQHQRLSVSSLADHHIAGVEELAVPVPLHDGRGRGVDDAGDLHLVTVPAVDERLRLLDLGFMLDVQSDLKQKVQTPSNVSTSDLC